MIIRKLYYLGLVSTAVALSGCASNRAPAEPLCERTIGLDKAGEPITLSEPCVIVQKVPPAVFVSPERDDPPADDPPADDPPADDLPADDPPADDPPADDPPADDPPADDPPADDLPADDPPADDPPTCEPKPDKPSKRGPKDDNSDANGKGGNKHARPDKNKPSQEIAENKKNK